MLLIVYFSLKFAGEDVSRRNKNGNKTQRAVDSCGLPIGRSARPNGQRLSCTGASVSASPSE